MNVECTYCKLPSFMRLFLAVYNCQMILACQTSKLSKRKLLMFLCCQGKLSHHMKSGVLNWKTPSQELVHLSLLVKTVIYSKYSCIFGSVVVIYTSGLDAYVEDIGFIISENILQMIRC
uniref:tRNA pseudouridine38/39 synthase n=1 Tax=Rhizophora mucronata TaxID=61149 RepID=A0A2P2LQK1_RHIMU